MDNSSKYIPALRFKWLTPLYDPLLKRAMPNAIVTGMDGDPQVLAIARQKSRGIDIQWDQGLASSLPYPDSAFDRIVTSLVIHHLTQ